MRIGSDKVSEDMAIPNFKSIFSLTLLLISYPFEEYNIYGLEDIICNLELSSLLWRAGFDPVKGVYGMGSINVMAEI